MEQHTKKAIDVMQAFVWGEQIQCRKWSDGACSQWRDASDSLWDWQTYDYRVKPKSDSYEPYTVKDMDELPPQSFWVLENGSGTRRVIVSYNEGGVVFNGSTELLSYSVLLNYYTHVRNGRPCGKGEE